MPAVDGAVVGCPPEFTQGDGAFGCRESHCSILRRHLMEREQGWVLVLEDDADFKPSFVEEVTAFLELVRQRAPNAEGLMLGGQHHAEPKLVAPGIVRVTYAQRTHAYACRGLYMRALYHRWSTTIDAHIDWRMENWQVYQKVYAPQHWLVGQTGGRSDISGASKQKEWWVAPTGHEPVVLLRATRAAVVQLRRCGLHTGFDRDPKTDFDKGIGECFDPDASPAERRKRLADWIRMIQEECVASDSLICTVWHPEATLQDVEGATKAEVYLVEAETVAEALPQLPDRRPGPPVPDGLVVLLRAPRDVAEELRQHGFHAGYWCGPDGIDNGLREIFDQPEAERPRRLRQWHSLLKREVMSMPFGVVTVWHPAATREVLECLGGPVLEISAGSVGEALDQWREYRKHLRPLNASVSA